MVRRGKFVQCTVRVGVRRVLCEAQWWWLDLLVNDVICVPSLLHACRCPVFEIWFVFSYIFLTSLDSHFSPSESGLQLGSDTVISCPWNIRCLSIVACDIYYCHSRLGWFSVVSGNFFPPCHLHLSVSRLHMPESLYPCHGAASLLLRAMTQVVDGGTATFPVWFVRGRTVLVPKQGFQG